MKHRYIEIQYSDAINIYICVYSVNKDDRELNSITEIMEYSRKEMTVAR